METSGVSAAGEGCQTENIVLGRRAPRVVGRLEQTEEVLQRFHTTRTTAPFGNRGKAVIATQAANLDHSLLFIAGEGAEFHYADSVSGKRQVRAHFTYRDDDYDLPVTDPDFERKFARRPANGLKFHSCYLTLSLGVEFEGWHHKLVAGVFLI